MSVALAKFQDRVQASLDALEADLRRADAWIDHDRPAHWRKQIHEAEKGVHDAKLELERCLMMTVVEGQRPACREQKAALEKAKVRLDYCREKAELVKKWQRNFRHDAMEFHGRIGQLRRLLEQDVPNARALLAKIVLRLEEYRLEQAPDAHSAHGVLDSAAAESHARTVVPAQSATIAAPTETVDGHE